MPSTLFDSVSLQIFAFLMGVTACLMGYNASGTLHNNAAKRVLRAPMAFFDTTPLGRIMNRFSKDQDTIDNTLNDSMRMALSTLGQVAGSIGKPFTNTLYFFRRLIAPGSLDCYRQPVLPHSRSRYSGHLFQIRSILPQVCERDQASCMSLLLEL